VKEEIGKAAPQIDQYNKIRKERSNSTGKERSEATRLERRGAKQLDWKGEERSNETDSRAHSD